MNHAARKEVVKGDYANAAALAKRYGVDRSTIHKRVKNFLKKSKKASSEIFRRDGLITMFDVRKTDKIFGYKDVVTQDDLFADRAEVDAAAKRIAAHVPKVGFSLRKDKPEADKKVYQPTYDDFFEWCSKDRAWPKIFFEDYVKLANLDDSCNHEIVKFATGTAMRECWVSWFDKIKKYLSDIVGTKKPERKESPVFGCGMIKPGYLDFMRRMAARNAAEKEGGAK